MVVAPSYPVSYFPTQNPLTSKLVKAGWVNHSPLDVPVDDSILFDSNSIWISFAILVEGLLSIYVV